MENKIKEKQPRNRSIHQDIIEADVEESKSENGQDFLKGSETKEKVYLRIFASDMCRKRN